MQTETLILILCALLKLRAFIHWDRQSGFTLCLGLEWWGARREPVPRD